MIGNWVPSLNYYYCYKFEIILMYGLDGTCTLSMYSIIKDENEWDYLVHLVSFDFTQLPYT